MNAATIGYILEPTMARIGLLKIYMEMHVIFDFF